MMQLRNGKVRSHGQDGGTRTRALSSQCRCPHPQTLCCLNNLSARKWLLLYRWHCQCWLLNIPIMAACKRDSIVVKVAQILWVSPTIAERWTLSFAPELWLWKWKGGSHQRTKNLWSLHIRIHCTELSCTQHWEETCSHSTNLFI